VSDATLDELIEAWSAADAGLSTAEIDRRILGFGALVRAIAEHGRATPAAFAEATGLSPAEASKVIGGLAAGGIQVDDAGDVVGAALTTLPTPHRFRVRQRDLFAWCALDTLFLPGLLNETAEIHSSCPETGTEVHLTVSPDRVEACRPRGAVLSVVNPHALGRDRSTGPASPT